MEDALTWHLVLLGSTVGGLQPAALLPLLPQLEQLVDQSLQVRWGGMRVLCEGRNQGFV
jgi:urea transporter